MISRLAILERKKHVLPGPSNAPKSIKVTKISFKTKLTVKEFVELMI